MAVVRYQGRYSPEARAIAAPLLSDDASEATRAARTLANLSAAKRRREKSARTWAHIMALRASINSEQVEF